MKALIITFPGLWSSSLIEGGLAVHDDDSARSSISIHGRCSAPTPTSGWIPTCGRWWRVYFTTYGGLFSCDGLY